MLLSEWASLSGIDMYIYLFAWTKTSVSHPSACLSFTPMTPMHHQCLPLQISKHISNPINVPIYTPTALFIAFYWDISSEGLPSFCTCIPSLPYPFSNSSQNDLYKIEV